MGRAAAQQQSQLWQTERIENERGRRANPRGELRHHAALQSTKTLSNEADGRFLRQKVKPLYSSQGADSIRVVDLFGGCGGMTLGIAEAARAYGRGLEVVGAYDFDRDAVTVYNENFGSSTNESPSSCEDIGEFFESFASKTNSKERELEKKCRNGLDVLVGGPPCQGHSDLNNHTRRNDPRNALYVSMARAAKLLKPRIVVIENVRAVVHDTGRVVDRTREHLESLDYNVSDLVVQMERLGVPQTRRRHLMIATQLRKDGLATKVVERLRTMQEDTTTPTRTVWWAIEDLETADRRLASAFDRPGTPAAKTRERIDWLFDHGLYILPDAKRPACHRDKDHSYTTVYGRMKKDQPGPTITTGFGSMGQGCFVHPTQRRTISPHEAARLQTFPDFFRFDRTITSRGAWAKLIGNAVPPLLMRLVIDAWLQLSK